MENVVQTEQSLLEELDRLRTRVAELERAEKERQLLPGHPQNNRPELEMTIFEALTEAVAVYDCQGNIVRINAAFRQLLGVDAQPEYTNKPLEERFALLNIRTLHGQFLHAAYGPVTRILQGAVLKDESSTDLFISTLDQRELLINISGTPIYNEHGYLQGAVIICRDVTMQRKLERRTKEMLHALLAMAEVLVQGAGPDHSPVKLVIQRLAKLSRRILHCHSATITLVEPDTERLCPLVITGVMPAEKQYLHALLADTHLNDHLVDKQQLEALRAGRPLRIDITQPLWQETGSASLLIPMRVRAQLVGLLALDYGKEIRNLSGVEIMLAESVSKLFALVLERERLLQERAESKANELALLQANRRMDEFLSIASHELRTPLTTIKGNIQLAKRRLRALLQTNEPGNFTDRLHQIQDLLSRAERQVHTQNRLVSDLLDVSRIQANQLDLHIAHCDLTSIVHEVVEDQRTAFPQRNISLHIAAGPEIPVMGDADRISQVIANYLINALKYSAATQPVEVSLEVHEGYGRISVHDKGPGIAEEELKRLWQRFYRVPGIKPQHGQGTGLGLGLHICRTIIEQHHGEVGVESIPGKGSTFWFTLPLASPLPG
ncbi:PAS domain-containing protein [Ktedonosporobacter rubrisoli]|uniref:histidine kinase n=1 Tax=Ktedonosporobacter rubrisoli TaxID=2509675 RepID=A0A4P6K0H3_KTERU|nr:PAS domain-containing sensor histidine kinase [Ktedonosporobacter rubrisoli]QBD81534.1 PAS domain-containing protein [Ktedonosporobacter rubrisoli]